MNGAYICKICGFKAKTPQGLFGHIRLKHKLSELAEQEGHKHLTADEVLECPYCGPVIVRRLIQRLADGDPLALELIRKPGFSIARMPVEGDPYFVLCATTNPTRKFHWGIIEYDQSEHSEHKLEHLAVHKHVTKSGSEGRAPSAGKGPGDDLSAEPTSGEHKGSPF